MMSTPWILLAFLAAALPARAQAPCHAENDGNNFNTNVSMGGPKLLLAVRFTAPSNLSVDRIEVFTGEASGTNTVALWSHDAGLNKPAAVIGGSGSWSMSSTNSWQGAALSSSTALSSGSDYWMVWGCINGSQASVDLPMTTLGQVYRGSFDGGANWNGPWQFASDHWKFRLFCGATPVVFCQGKVNSLGCIPAIGSSGTPSATSGSGFAVTCAMVRNQKPGLLFYTANGAQNSLAFQCGTLCVGPQAIHRTPAQVAGGSPPPANDCSGTYAIDMNAFAAGALGGAPDPGLLLAGTPVHCQWWGRDQGFAAPCNTTLSDALEYTVGA